MVWWPLLLLVGLLCVCSFICFGFFVLQCWVSFVGALHVGLCQFCFVLCLVLGLLSWCTALCASVSSVLSCVWCLVSLVGALHIVLVSFRFVCVCVFVQFLHEVGGVRFPGEVGELAPYGGAPYLRWANSDGFVLYPRYG